MKCSIDMSILSFTTQIQYFEIMNTGFLDQYHAIFHNLKEILNFRFTMQNCIKSNFKHVCRFWTLKVLILDNISHKIVYHNGINKISVFE